MRTPFPIASRIWRPPLLLPALLLAACAGLPPAVEPEGGISWQAHREAVLGLDSWRLEGRLNIRGADRSDTINLRWDQDPEAFEINMSGRLGLGSVRITGDGGGVVVEKAGEAPVHAESLEEVSVDYLGYAFPAEELYYWIRGVDAPGARKRLTFNAQQRLATLSQDGWTLEYDRYLEAGNVILPGRIRMDYPPYRLTFLISGWEVE